MVPCITNLLTVYAAEDGLAGNLYREGPVWVGKRKFFSAGPDIEKEGNHGNDAVVVVYTTVKDGMRYCYASPPPPDD